MGTTVFSTPRPTPPPISTEAMKHLGKKIENNELHAIYIFKTGPENYMTQLFKTAGTVSAAHCVDHDMIMLDNFYAF